MLNRVECLQMSKFSYRPDGTFFTGTANGKLYRHTYANIAGLHLVQE